MFFNKILNYIFPCVCIICGKKIIENETYTCENCANIIKYMMNDGICINFKEKYFDELISALHYDGIIRQRILEFKFKNKPYLEKFFSNCLIKILKQNNVKFDLIIPVPLHYKRYFERGYNQSTLLARNISKYFNIKYSTRILKKIHNTKAQSSLSYIEREKNVLNSYKVLNQTKIKGKTILLVDDVFTTGSTVNECSRALKENGANKVIVVTVSFVRRNLNG